MPLSEMEHLDESVAAIIQEQDAMGWDSVMFGSLHQSWSREQGEYLSVLDKRTTGTTWASQLIRKYGHFNTHYGSIAILLFIRMVNLCTSMRKRQWIGLLGRNLYLEEMHCQWNMTDFSEVMYRGY